MFLSSSCEILGSKDTGADFAASGAKRKIQSQGRRLERSGKAAVLCGKTSLIIDKQLFESSSETSKKESKGRSLLMKKAITMTSFMGNGLVQRAIKAQIENWKIELGLRIGRLETGNYKYINCVSPDSQNMLKHLWYHMNTTQYCREPLTSVQHSRVVEIKS